MNKRLIIGLMILLAVILFGVGISWIIKQQQTNSICGGIAGKLCPAGYTCSYLNNATYPDAAGRCVPKK